MTRARDWKIPVAAALSAATLALSCWGLLGLAPLGPRHIGAFAAGHDKRSVKLLETSGSPPAVARAAEESRLALSLAPYDNSARLRLAYIDRRQRGFLGPEGVAHFSRSYELVPYDLTVAAWRIRFGLENWAALTPQARAAVRREALAFGRAHSADVDVRGVLNSIRNPNGRLAGALWLHTMDG